MTTPATSKASTVTADEASVPAAVSQVINNQERNPFKRKPSPRPRTFNDSGVQTIKGGQALDVGFFDAITTAYTNLVNTPLALCGIIFATFCFVTLATQTDTPVVLTYNSLLTAANNETNPYAVRSVATLFTYVFSLFLDYEVYIAISIMFGAVYLAKPSTNNAYLCATLGLIAMIGKFNSWELLALGHCFLVYTQIRDTAYKLSVGLLAVICVIFGFAHMSNMTGLSSMKLAGSSGSSGGGGGTVTP